MMNPKDILNKIKKLLSLANSSNENESQLAANKANEILTKHNLSMQDVDKASRQYMGEQVSHTTRRSYHRELIYSILMKFYFVEVLQSKRPGSRSYGVSVPGDIKTLIFGEEHNVEIAKYVFEFLDRAFLNGWETFKKENKHILSGRMNSYRNSYFDGFYKGLHEKLSSTRKSVEQETGLVVVKDPGIMNFMKNEFGKLSTTKSLSNNTVNGDAMRAGYEHGKNTNIAIGLGDKNGGEQRFLNGGK